MVGTKLRLAFKNHSENSYPGCPEILQLNFVQNQKRIFYKAQI